MLLEKHAGDADPDEGPLGATFEDLQEALRMKDQFAHFRALKACHPGSGFMGISAFAQTQG